MHADRGICNGTNNSKDKMILAVASMRTTSIRIMSNPQIIKTKIQKAKGGILYVYTYAYICTYTCTHLYVHSCVYIYESEHAFM